MSISHDTVSPGDCADGTLNQAMLASFRILSNSLFIINQSLNAIQSSLLTAFPNKKQTETPFLKCDIMYIPAHSCLGQSQSKGNTAQKKKKSVAGNYITANKFFHLNYIYTMKYHYVEAFTAQNKTIKLDLKLIQEANSELLSI